MRLSKIITSLLTVNHSRSRVSWLAIYLLVIFSTLLSGCTTVEKAEPSFSFVGTELTISTETVSRVGQLSIGLGDIVNEEYTIILLSSL